MLSGAGRFVGDLCSFAGLGGRLQARVFAGAASSARFGAGMGGRGLWTWWLGGLVGRVVSLRRYIVWVTLCSLAG